MSALKVRDLMSREPITLEENETLDLAGEIMKLARIRHLPVVRGETLVGLVTHRDLLRAQVSALASVTASEARAVDRSIPAAAIMTRDVRSIGPDDDAVDAARLMKEYKLGCLPVVEEDARLVGIITEADFLDLVIRALETGP